MDKTDLHEIYRFWFGENASADTIDPARVKFWMHQNDETDRQVREGFEHLLADAAACEWNIDELSREEAMALVVLFDQCPRNIYRTSGDAFAYDPLARDLARRLTAQGWDHFTAAERFFLCLPFVHHEDIIGQDEAVMHSAREVLTATEKSRDEIRFGLDQAIRHRTVIQRFGRFPHRNKMLGRESTAEEIEFMAGAVNGRGF